MALVLEEELRSAVAMEFWNDDDYVAENRPLQAPVLAGVVRVTVHEHVMPTEVVFSSGDGVEPLSSHDDPLRMASEREPVLLEAFLNDDDVEAMVIVDDPMPGVEFLNVDDDALLAARHYSARYLSTRSPLRIVSLLLSRAVCYSTSDDGWDSSNLDDVYVATTVLFDESEVHQHLHVDVHVDLVVGLSLVPPADRPCCDPDDFLLRHVDGDAHRSCALLVYFHDFR